MQFHLRVIQFIRQGYTQLHLRAIGRYMQLHFGELGRNTELGISFQSNMNKHR